VAFWITGEGIAILPDTNTTRIRSIGNANWTLMAQNPGKTRLTSGTAKAANAINIFDTQFFALDLENEAITRQIADALADQITLQLAAYFRERTPTPVATTG
jgi:LPS-assembly lipoprotein